MSACVLCNSSDESEGEIVWRNDDLRVLLVNDARYPGFCRVIWNAHVQEMTDLEAVQRARIMDVVWRVESAVRTVMQPHKINLASLGNMVPHVHWHIIPRYADDAHFPQPIWGTLQRPDADVSTRTSRLPALKSAILEQLS
jgi:diadenosine tetraphosphate (Ap4A) HIT family hydrolase